MGLRAGMPEPPRASHLVVLQHGLYGDATSLHALQAALDDLDGGAGELVVLSASGSVGRTRDGVAKGGERLAAEVRAAAARQPSLQSLSLVGSALGSLYARHAAGLLLDEAGLMAGLRPEAFVTLGCPRIGEPVENLPTALHRIGERVAGSNLTLDPFRHLFSPSVRPPHSTHFAISSPHLSGPHSSLDASLSHPTQSSSSVRPPSPPSIPHPMHLSDPQFFPLVGQIIIIIIPHRIHLTPYTSPDPFDPLYLTGSVCDSPLYPSPDAFERDSQGGAATTSSCERARSESFDERAERRRAR